MYENFIVPLPSRARKPRPQTLGILLDNMCKSMGGLRIPISVAEGNRRPHDLMQAAKFASEAGVVVRHQVPILMHWKQYTEKRHDAVYCTRFVDRLNVWWVSPMTSNSALSNFNRFTFHSHYYVQQRLRINGAHSPTKEAC